MGRLGASLLVRQRRGLHGSLVLAESPSEPVGRRRSPTQRPLTTDRMDTRDLVVGTVLLLKSIIGLLGNLSLLSHQLFLYLTGCRPRATDLAVKNLIVANFLVLFSSGICYPVELFAWYHIFTNFGCKFFLYVRQVGMGVSMGTTCLLSVVQAVTISPQGSRWARLREKAPRCILPCVALCWVVNLLVNVIYPVFFSNTLSRGNISNTKSFGHCSVVRFDQITDSLFAALLSSPKVLCVGLMVGASGSMVCTLYRHRQRVRHLQRSSASSTCSPESRATRTILLLVSTFVFFYTVFSIFQLSLTLFHNPDLLLVTITAVISTSFPAISPFLLMSQDPSVSRFFSAWRRNLKAPHL
ncbi:vomeronasal type-1 receptor 4-like [Talpa occidentalis]|uniref:vomeronasal type-1 receptor 4-like n=1 Tax=Talpa occidentalis TaxID=50954 RepID=UPI00188FAFD1|nr:vomeronasal type-1 receptor 4-like [Talpa occidentalis]XP_037371494.1 vomeronasal type-1 receptor 4-like [Talpa occidentalis]